VLALAACGDLAVLQPVEALNDGTAPADGATPADEPPGPSDDHVLPDLVNTGIEPRLEIIVQPVGSVYTPGSEVSVRARVMESGIEREPASAWVQIDPPRMATSLVPGSGRYTLDVEGRADLSGCAEYAGRRLCAERSILIDAGPPQIQIDWPPSGIVSSDLAITVRGRVSDSHGTPRVFLGGDELDLDDSGGFAAVVPPEFGIQHIAITSTDGFHPEQGYAALDVLWAPAFLSSRVPGALSFALPEALVARLSQSAFDDGVTAIVAPEALDGRANDVASLVEIALSRLDLGSLMPDPLADSESFALRVNNALIHAPRVELDLTDGGLSLFIELGELQIDTEGFADIGDALLDLAGSATFDIAAFVELEVSRESADDGLWAEIVDFGLALESARGEFVSPEADALFEIGESALRSLIDGAFIEGLTAALLEQIPTALTEIIAGFDDALQFTNLAIALDPLPAAEMLFSGRTARVQPLAEQRLELAMDATITASSAVALDPGRGVPVAELPASESPLRTDAPLALALDQRLANTALYTLWAQGLLELPDVVSAFPPAGLLADRVGLSAKLPPVLSVAPDGYLELALGQLEVTLESGGAREVHGINIVTRASLVTLGDELEVSLSSQPEVIGWVVERTAGDPVFADSQELAELIVDLVWPSITNAARDSLAFPALQVDLSGVLGLAPSIREMNLALRLDEAIDQQGNYIVLTGRLEGVVGL